MNTPLRAREAVAVIAGIEVAGPPWYGNPPWCGTGGMAGPLGKRGTILVRLVIQ
jgi:hypothetical protein